VLPTAALGDSLPDWGKMLWEQGGRLTAEDEEIRKTTRSWKTDSAVTDKPYYTIVQGPIFTENPSPTHLVHDFPGNIPSGAPGVTFNMWFQPLNINQTDCMMFVYYGGQCNVSGCNKPFAVHDTHWKRGPGCAQGACTQERNFFDTGCPDSCLYVNVMFCSYFNSGRAGRINIINTYGSPDAAYTMENGGVWREDDPTQRVLDEKNFASRNSAPYLTPNAWRMLTVRVDMQTRALEVFFDAELTSSSKTGNHANPSAYSEIPSYFQLQDLSQGFVRIFGEDIRSQTADPERVAALHRVAEIRVYPDVLTNDELRRLHVESEWPQGGKIRQCALPYDPGYFDSMESDAGKRDCLWYAKNIKRAPYICSSSEAMTMCPVTCRGRRQCHDGSQWRLFQPPMPRPIYRIFDRVMRLKPRDAQSSVICPSNKNTRAQLVAKCRKSFEDNGCASCAKGDAGPCGPATGCHACSYPGGCDSPKWTKSVNSDLYDIDKEYAAFFGYYKRTDHYNCDQVERNIGDCTWDASWIPQFLNDVKETKFFSISVWMKPTAASAGMPRFFFPFLRLMTRKEGRVATLVTMGDRRPNLVDLFAVFDAYFSFSFLLNSALFDYTDWTRIYVSWEKRADGIWYKCIAINAKAVTCVPKPPPTGHEQADGPFDYLPEDLLESVEVHTEVLLGPIEFTSQREPDSVLQQKFYKRKAELEKIEGARVTERDRVEAFNAVTEKEVGSYDEKLGLVAPPLMFQKRLQVAPCNPAVASPFLKAQFELVNVSHCPKEAMCPSVKGAQDVMQCVGSEESSDDFYGLSTKTLNNEVGFADFLFTYSDNPIVVRGGRTLPTRNFFDSKTQEGKVIAAFVTPGGFRWCICLDACVWATSFSLHRTMTSHRVSVWGGVNRLASLTVCCVRWCVQRMEC
jgi:hypothetical protein